MNANRRCRPTVLGLLILAGLGVSAAGCAHEGTASGEPDPPTHLVEVEVATAARGPMQTMIELVGTLLPIRSTTVVPEVDGIILEFPASQREVQLGAQAGHESFSLSLDIGDEVARGEALVQLDPTDSQLALDLAEANYALVIRELERLRAVQRPEEIARLEAAVEGARAADNRARADLDRFETLLNRRTIPQSDYDLARMEAETAAAGLRQAEAALAYYRSRPTAEEIAVAEAQVAAAEAEVRLRAEKVAKTTVRAPYDAVVTDRFVEVGDRVTAMPRVEIMEIADPSVLFGEVAVPERYQNRVRLDDPAVVFVEGFDEPVRGRVERINAKIDAQTRTFRVRVTIDNRRRALRLGGFVRVALPLAAAEAVLQVPAAAINYSEGRPGVFVFHPEGNAGEGRVERRSVALGMSDRHAQEIVSGLAEGERVAVGQTSLLTDGLRVRRMEPRRKPQRNSGTEPRMNTDQHR
jgi:multidrug efflux pump subunit AcrA (membrane-fusion protein)